MPFIILFLLISWPVLEVASIVEVSRWIGPLATFLLLAASFTCGVFLIRSQGAAMAQRAMEAVKAGSQPAQPLLDSGAIVFAGILFMIPGFFSDILALLLLLPSMRSLIWRGATFGFRTETRAWRAERGPGRRPEKPQRSPDVIDVEFTEVPRERRPGDSGSQSNSPWGKP
jgi:UPF0716 protein FxsA